MNMIQRAVTAASLFALFAAPALHAQSNVVATVNGVKIPETYMDFMLKTQEGKPAGKHPDELRKVIRERLIDQEVLVQEAKRSGLLKKPDTQAFLAISQDVAISNIYLREWLKEHPVTEEEIRKAYDDWRGRTPGQEYHARHILVGSEDEAKRVIRELKAGAKFETLASESKDPGSKARGGDLGWALPSVYVKPFADALVNLKKGEITETPVKTRFGYHVIQLEDVRSVQTPPLEKVEPSIRRQLEQQKKLARIAELRAKAKIQ